MCVRMLIRGGRAARISRKQIGLHKRPEWGLSVGCEGEQFRDRVFAEQACDINAVRADGFDTWGGDNNGLQDYGDW